MTPLVDIAVHVAKTLAVLSLGHNTIHGFAENSFSKVIYAVPPTGTSKLPCSIMPPILPFNEATKIYSKVHEYHVFCCGFCFPKERRNIWRLEQDRNRSYFYAYFNTMKGLKK